MENLNKPKALSFKTHLVIVFLILTLGYIAIFLITKIPCESGFFIYACAIFYILLINSIITYGIFFIVISTLLFLILRNKNLSFLKFYGLSFIIFLVVTPLFLGIWYYGNNIYQNLTALRVYSSEQIGETDNLLLIGNEKGLFEVIGLNGEKKKIIDVSSLLEQYKSLEAKLSPNGKFLAFTDDAYATGTMYVTNLESKKIVIVGTCFNNPNTFDWSPDSKFLAFTRYSGDVSVFDVSSRNIITDYSGLSDSWNGDFAINITSLGFKTIKTPNGQYIAEIIPPKEREDKEIKSIFGVKIGTVGIAGSTEYTIVIKTKDGKILSELKEQWELLGTPEWSLDNRFLVYRRGYGGGRIYIFDLKSKKLFEVKGVTAKSVDWYSGEL